MKKFAALCVLAVSTSAAFAQTYATGFEEFSNGAIDNQNGWNSDNPAFNANVVSTVVRTGNKSFYRDNRTGSGSFGDQTFSAGTGGVAGESTAVGVTPGQNVFKFTTWFRAGSTGGPDGTVIGIAGTDNQGSRAWSLSLRNNEAGGASLYAFDVDPALQAAGSASFRQFTLGQNLSLSAWHRIDVVSIFNDGQSNDVVQYFLNGALVQTLSSWEQYYRWDPEQAGNGNQLWGIDRMIFRTVGTSNDSNGFYFDDFSTQVVPEPATMAILGLGALALRRRRKQA